MCDNAAIDPVYAHLPDQCAQLRADLRSPSLRARLPTPAGAKAGPVPTHEGLGPDDGKEPAGLTETSGTSGSGASAHGTRTGRDHSSGLDTKMRTVDWMRTNDDTDQRRDDTFERCKLHQAMFAFRGKVLQKSEVERRQKFRESQFLADSIAAKLHSVDTRVGGRFA